MLKTTLLILATLFCFTSPSQAQKLKHYLSYNFSYTSFFYPVKRNYPYLTSLVIPSLSYKIQKGSYGLELFGTIGAANYELWDKDQYNKAYLNSRLNTATYITYILSGISVHYSILNKKWLKVSPNAGLAFGWYKGDRMAFWSRDYSQESGDWWYEMIVDVEVETKFGAIVGVNAIVPIYKSLYFNSDIKFFTFPFAKYSKKNLLFQVGFGYIFNRNKKTNP